MRYSPAVVLSLWTFIRGEAWLSSPPRASWSPHRRRSFVLNDDTNNNNNHLFPRSNMMMRLDMGGYYAEPDDVDDDDDPTATSRQNTHVIFGVRCAERVVPLTSAFHVTLLQPVSDDDDTGAVGVPSSAEMALASYLWERRPRRPCGDDTRPAGGFDSTTRSVAIWGDASGLITLTLLRWNEDIVVFSCASDPESLRRIQMAHWMFTDATTTTRAGTLETVHCDDERDVSTRADADVLIVVPTPPADNHDDDDTQRRQLQQWQERYATVVFWDANRESVQVLTRQ